MYKYCDINSKDISLHDCRATKVIFNQGILSFVFEDGIYLSVNHPLNDTNESIKTSKAEVQFELEFKEESDINIYVYSNIFNKTIRNEWSLNKLINYVDEQHPLEFLYMYHMYHSIFEECCLWSNKKPYFHECELKISCLNIKYCYNDINN